MNTPQRQSASTKALLLCGAIGSVLFVVVFLVLGATRSDYDALRHPVSSLSIGELGWMQAVNFIMTGLLFLAFALGLRRALVPERSFWAPLLIALVAIGLVSAGVFVTDPLGGYPPGAPPFPIERTLPGRLHDLFSILVFFCLPAACFVMSRLFAKRGERGWAIYSVLSGLAMLATFILAGVGFRQLAGLADLAGGWQRLSILIGWTWIALLAFYFLKHPAQT